MKSKKLSILIPSYKRPLVLEYTLNHLLKNIENNTNFSINIVVGLNKATNREKYIVNVFENKFKEIDIDFKSVSYENNIGKAKMLNILFKIFAYKSDFIITMDNDIVILKPFLKYLNLCELVDYDIMSFSSARYWAHNPIKEVCPFITVQSTIFYTPINVGGGILLFHNDFLKAHPFEDNNGVYGKVDLSMCLKTKKIYVLDIKDDVFLHDPLRNDYPELIIYENKKQSLIKKGITVFPKDWDEI